MSNSGARTLSRIGGDQAGRSLGDGVPGSVTVLMAEQAV
jgi:hypothetical protein